MTTVKLTCARVGQCNDKQGRPGATFAQSAGSIVSLPDDEAQRYIERGLAEPVESNTKGGRS